MWGISFPTTGNPVGLDLPSAQHVATVALDASVLINFLILNRVDVLANLSGHRFVVLDAVEQEVLRPRQQATLAAAFDQRLVDRVGAATPGELEIFAEHRKMMGLGEAACLAAAEIRGWMLASDERRVFRRVARVRIGDARILTTPGILVLAVGGGVISVEELRGAREELERNRFTVPSAAYGGLLEE